MDTGPTISFGIGDTKYVFNVGENASRALINKSANWTNIRAFFLTQTTIGRGGGLSGLLRRPDRLSAAVDVVGPPGLAHYMASMRFHLHGDSTRVNVIEASFDPEPEPYPTLVFQDTNLSVYSVAITPGDHAGNSPNAGESEASSALSPSQAQEWRTNMIDLMFPAEQRQQSSLGHSFYQQLPALHSKHASGLRPAVAYVAISSPMRDECDGQKADPPSAPSNWRKSGNNVNGGSVKATRVVRPDDNCRATPVNPTVVVILDVPSPSYIPSLINSFTRSPLYSKIWSRTPEYTVSSVFHLCGEGVLEDERYIEFMNGFPADTHHVISSSEYERDAVTFATAALHQLRLNQFLDPDIFPAPHFSLAPEKELANISGLPATSVLMESGLHIGVLPATPLSLPDEQLDQFHPAMPTVRIPAFAELVSWRIAKVKDAVSKEESRLQTGRQSQFHSEEVLERYKRLDSVTVIPLGTAAYEPTAFRNFPSTLVCIPGYGSILLDAGEGTMGQLVRQFGVTGVWNVLRDLKCIFVSNAGAAYSHGVAAVLAKRQQLDPPATKPIYLVGDPLLHISIRDVHQIENLGLDDPSGNGTIPVISNALHFSDSVGKDRLSGRQSPDGKDHEYARSWAARVPLCEALGLLSFQTVHLPPQHNCYGVVLRHKDGWSVVYALHTPTIHNLAVVGRNATLLIYGATVDDIEQGTTPNTPITEAVDLGEKMKAKYVLLTHFAATTVESQLVIPVGKSKPTVCFAFDHAKLRIGDMWKMNLYHPVIRQIYKHDVYSSARARET